MGRFYTGDIEGKFWFAVQSSDDASFFGGEIFEPQYLDYYFSKDDLKTIKAGLTKCEKALGKHKVKLDKFFDDNDGGYNKEMVSKALGITEKKVLPLLKWYARLDLGKKIYKRVKETGECSFEAEI